MATYVLIHGAGDRAFYWHLVERELRARGHDVVAVDLPCDDESAGLAAYTDTVVAAIGDRTDLIVVAQSFGGFTAPLVCARLPVELLVLVAAMIPAPGETASAWSTATGLDQTDRDDADYDGRELEIFYHDVPPALAAEALRHGRAQSWTPWKEPWPLDAWPDVPTRFVLCRDDRVFPAAWLRGVVRDRLGIVADELDGGHCPALSRPHELVERLEAFRAELPPVRVRYADTFDAEIYVHNERMRAAAAIRPGERVLDIGCGRGVSTRLAAAAAAPAPVLGVDVSGPMLELARERTAAAGLDNARYEQGDAQVYPFAAGQFDVAISRFGAMFFADPVAAFANIARALRPGGRLVLLVWQRRELNEWATAIHRALHGDAPLPSAPALDAFSLGDRAATERVLASAGFGDLELVDVDEPVFYGRDVRTALQLIRGFQTVRDALAAMDRDAAARAEQRLHDMVTAHHRGDRGVVFDSRAWLITATREAVTRRDPSA
jgi:SAM-dependent methyltransferase